MPKLKVTLFKRGTVTVGPVELEALMKVGEEEVSRSARDVLDAIISETSELLAQRRADLFIVEGESGDTKYVIGEGVKDRSGTRLISFRPQRLVRLGIIRLPELQRAIQGEGYAKLNLNSIEWYDVPPDIYVYDGPIKAPDDVEYLVLQLEDGFRVLRAPRLSRISLSLQPPTEQDQGSQAGGGGSGEGTAPSE